ncbi:hypothetical protein ACNUDM_11715 [Vibrio chaetopteri]|uniref:hypothetical protein n=1 Tax=Vibrio chaetopteri TaxID=3016528 RepID=UPI003AB588D1
MQLSMNILAGERSGTTILLGELGSKHNDDAWLKEDEPVEIRLRTSAYFQNACLELYDHKVEQTYVEFDGDHVEFVWRPKSGRNRNYERLFINFFGIAELSVLLSGDDGEVLKHFQPLEILASKLNAENVEKMLDFLALIGDEELHSLFQTTKHGAGFTSGSSTPISNLERLERSASKLTYLLQEILSRPITKLLPQAKMVNTSGQEALDDNAIGWLMTNLSVANATDDFEHAHFIYQNTMFHADSLQLPILEESTNIYENQVIHGFIISLLQESQKQLEVYTNLGATYGSYKTNCPHGYMSFFSQINKLKKRLLGNQQERCESIVNALKAIKVRLEKILPVNHAVIQRPIITPKVASHRAYKSVFIEYIEWFEKNTPDWSVYQHLLAIQSIPLLFEAYCYYRVAISLSQILSPSSEHLYKTLHADSDGNEVHIIREPIYWMPRNNRAIENHFINSEGTSINGNRIYERSQDRANSHRKPDIVIEVRLLGQLPQLIVLDAKYTKPSLALEKYLPECTMKYVHGIHDPTSNSAPVKSMTILFPDTQDTFYSHHSYEYSSLGSKPVVPALQALGLNLDTHYTNDPLDHKLSCLLKQAGIFVGDLSLLKLEEKN